jgi:hypothetical protein
LPARLAVTAVQARRGHPFGYQAAAGTADDMTLAARVQTR